MEEKYGQLTLYLDSLDQNSSSLTTELLDLSKDQGLISYIIDNLQVLNSIKLLRQLLQYTPSTAMEFILTNDKLPLALIDYLKNNRIDFDSTKVFAEVYDEGAYKDLIDDGLIEKLVSSIEGSSENACENLIKVLIIIGNFKLERIILSNHSRYFGEMLVFRVNRASGVEKKYLLKTISRIVYGFPQFFYINDLKLLVDIICEALSNQEEENFNECLSTLDGITEIEDFLQAKYRFEELLELLQTLEPKDSDHLHRIILKLNNNN